MKVYEQIVISIATGEVLSERAFEYSGPVVECKGGGGDVDEEYNARMATIAEKQQGIGDQMWNYMQYGVNYDPTQQATEKVWVPGTSGTGGGMPEGAWQDGGGQWYDQSGNWIDEKDYGGTGGTPGHWEERPTGQTYGDMYGYKGGGTNYIKQYLAADISGMEANANAANANAAQSYASAGLSTAQADRLNQLTPIEVELAGLTLEKAKTLTPLEVRNIKAQLDAEYPLIQKRADVESQGLDVTSQGLAAKSKGIAASEGLIPLQEQAARGYYDASINGIDPEVWGQRAQSDVEQAFKGSNADARREAARMGLNPKSGNYANEIRQQAIEKARLGGGARAIGTLAGERENYQRLGLAANTNPYIYGGEI